MKKSNCLKHLLYIAFLALFAISCTKENEPEIIGVSTELTAYEKYAADINSGRIDSSTLIITQDGGSIYYSYYPNATLYKLDKSYKTVWKYYCSKKVRTIDAITQLEDGSIIFTSQINATSFNDTPLLTKLNKNGEFLWEKGIGSIWVTEFSSIIQTADSGFALTGQQGYFGQWNILKTDKNGITLWNKDFKESDYYCDAQKIVQTKDNGYLVPLLIDFSFPIYKTRSCIVKLNQFGDTIKYTDLPSKLLICSDIIAANDDGYILVGSIERLGEAECWIYLFKINVEGDIVWSKPILPRKDRPFHLHIMKLLNTGYFIVVHSYEYSIIKIDNSGDLIN